MYVATKLLSKVVSNNCVRRQWVINEELNYMKKCKTPKPRKH